LSMAHTLQINEALRRKAREVGARGLTAAEQTLLRVTELLRAFEEYRLGELTGPRNLPMLITIRASAAELGAADLAEALEDACVWLISARDTSDPTLRIIANARATATLMEALGHHRSRMAKAVLDYAYRQPDFAADATPQDARGG